MKFVVCALILTATPSAFAQTVAQTIDCSEAYGKPAQCEVVACGPKYEEFLGKWSGTFSSYVRELSTKEKNAYRPFQNEVSYAKEDCLKNTESGETFLIGRRTDTYPAYENLPAKLTKGLLITGKKNDGTPFLRTIDDEGNYDYSLVYQNKVANMSVWSLSIPAAKDNPELRFVTVDGQDFSEPNFHKRNVTVTMSVGPVDAPYWEGVISSGSHSLKKQ